MAASSSLIVAVPPAASLSVAGRPPLSLLESHVLRKSPYYQDQYVTLNGKAVVLSHASLQCKSGFAEPRTVHVLREETYYDDDFHSFQVLRIDLPLEGKVPADYFRQVMEGEGEERGIERRSLTEHEQLIGRVTGEPVQPLSLPLLLPSTSPSSASPSALPSSSVFASVSKFVHQFNASYVLVKGFIEHAGAKVSEACARLREEAMAKARLVNRDWASRKNSVTELQMAVESVVMAAVYKKLFAGLCELYSKEEEATQARVQRMRQLSMEELGVREDCQCHPHVAIGLLGQLSSIPTVALQLAQLEAVSRALTAAVKDEGQAMAEEAQAAGEVGERRKRDTVLSAEDMIPLTLYVVLQSGLQHIQAHLQLLHHFAPSKQVGGIDHLQVHLANFQAACHIIDSGRTGVETERGGEEEDGGSNGRGTRDGFIEGKDVSASSVSGASSPLTSGASLSSSSTAASRAYHIRALSTSSSLGSLSSSHPRHRSPSSSPQPPLHRPSSVRSDDDGHHPHSQAAGPRSSRPPLGRAASFTLHDEASGDAHSTRGTARSRAQRMGRHAATLPSNTSPHADAASYPPPSSTATSASSSLSRSSKPSTNPFDSPARDGGGTGHFPFPLQRPLLLSSGAPPRPTARTALSTSAPHLAPGPLSSSTARGASPSSALFPRSLRPRVGERANEEEVEVEGEGSDDGPDGLGDFLSHLKRSDEVVTGSLRAIQQR